MLLFGSAVRVDCRTTLGGFVLAHLGLDKRIDGVVPDADALDALLGEVWNADVNRHLHESSAEGARSHVPAGDSRNGTLELLPDEWVYLPVVETRSPGWQLRSIPVKTADADTACTYVAAWAKENEYLLPPAGGQPVDGEPTMAAETLTGYALNSLLRQQLFAQTAYFYTARPGPAPVDAPPSTPAGGSSVANGRATPGWFLPFWHYIDRLRAEAATHAKVFDEVHDLIADGKLVVAVLGALDKTLSIMDRELKPSPPAQGFIDTALESLGNAFSPDHGLKQDIAELRAKVGPLRDQAKSQLVDNPTYPAMAQFDASLARLAAIEKEQAFRDLYAAFDADRAKYPLTEQAFQMACADYVKSRILDPQCDAIIGDLLGAFLKGTSGDSPILQEIRKVFSGETVKRFTDDSTSLVGLTVGNSPGPASLWVALTKIGFLWEINAIRVAPKAPRRGLLVVLQEYVDRLAIASGVPKDVLQKWETEQPKSQMPSAQAKATAARVAAAEEVQARTQSGPRFMGLLSLMNLWAFYSGLASAKSDKGALDVGGDLVGVATAGANLVADVAQLLSKGAPNLAVRGAALFGQAIEVPQAVDLLTGIGSRFGSYAAIGGAVFGAIQIGQGIRDEDWKKITAGSGSVLISIGWWVDVFISRRAALLVVEEGIGEVAAITVGETLLLGLGSMITAVGIIAIVVALAATHQDEIMRIAYALYTPGTQKFVDVIFQQLEKSAAVSVGPAAVRSAIADAKSASSRCTFVTWVVLRDGVADELHRAGLGDADIKLLMAIPTSTTPPMMR